MTVKNDFSIRSDFVTWRFSENAPLGSRKIVLNRHFVLRGSPSAVKPGLAWAGSARRARLRHRFGGSSRQAGSPSWSTRSGASRGDSANAGSCQFWFNGGDRLSAKLPLTEALTEAGLDRCVRIARTPRKARLTDRGLSRRLTRRVRLGIRRA